MLPNEIPQNIQWCGKNGCPFGSGDVVPRPLRVQCTSTQCQARAAHPPSRASSPTSGGSQWATYLPETGKNLAGYTGASFQRSTRVGSNADAPHFAVPFQVNPVGPVSTVRALRLHPIQFCVGQMRGHCRVHDAPGQNTRLLVGSNLGQNRNTS